VLPTAPVSLREGCSHHLTPSGPCVFHYTFFHSPDFPPFFLPSFHRGGGYFFLPFLFFALLPAHLRQTGQPDLWGATPSASLFTFPSFPCSLFFFFSLRTWSFYGVDSLGGAFVFNQVCASLIFVSKTSCQLTPEIFSPPSLCGDYLFLSHRVGVLLCISLVAPSSCAVGDLSLSCPVTPLSLD